MGEHRWDRAKNHKQTFVNALTFGALLIVAQGCGAPAEWDTQFAIEEDTEFLGEAFGSSQTTPTGVSTLAELQAMSSTGNYKLTANIDARAGLTPISFNGTFDGDTFTIDGLTLNLPTQSNVGLFSTLSGAIVKNLKLTNVNITGRDQVGGIAGTVFQSTITDSFVEGTVRGGSSTTQGTDVGLFAGQMRGGDIRRSYTSGSVLGYVTKVGGFIGNVSHTQAQGAVLKECYARVSVSPNTTNSNWNVLAGGFIGYAKGIDVSDIYASGSVRGRGPCAGLIAQVESTADRPISFYNSYSRNTVTDAAGPDRGSTYSTLSGTPTRLNGLLWDNTIDPAPVHPSTGQTGASTSTLKAATTPAASPYTNWSSAMWEAGSATQYHILKNVVRASQQPTQ